MEGIEFSQSIKKKEKNLSIFLCASLEMRHHVCSKENHKYLKSMALLFKLFTVKQAETEEKQGQTVHKLQIATFWEYIYIYIEREEK